MKQTIIYLTEEQHEALRKRAFDTKTSISALVRNAINELYTPKPVPNTIVESPKEETLDEMRARINARLRAERAAREKQNG